MEKMKDLWNRVVNWAKIVYKKWALSSLDFAAVIGNPLGIPSDLVRISYPGALIAKKYNLGPVYLLDETIKQWSPHTSCFIETYRDEIHLGESAVAIGDAWKGPIIFAKHNGNSHGKWYVDRETNRLINRHLEVS